MSSMVYAHSGNQIQYIEACSVNDRCCDQQCHMATRHDAAVYPTGPEVLQPLMGCKLVNGRSESCCEQGDECRV